MVIKAKLLTIKEDPTNNRATIYIELTDGNGHKWEKNYTYSVTEPITALQFKNRVKADLLNDLKPKTYLSEVYNLVGKEFTLTV